jgi:chromate transporter
MNLSGPIVLSGTEWWGFFLHFLMLSLLSIGGAINTVPDMQRYVVGDRQWLSPEQFSASVALAQAAPGPNLLFVPVIGYQVAGLAGAFVALLGMLIPSSTVALSATRWMQRHRDAIGVRAFVAGLLPVTLGLLLSTGWVLAQALRGSPWLVGFVAVVALATWRSKVPPVLWVLVGGALGWVGAI